MWLWGFCVCVWHQCDSVCVGDHCHWCLRGCVCSFGLMFVSVWHLCDTVCISDHYHWCLCGCVCVAPVWYNVYHTVITITDVCVAVCVALVWCLWHQCGTMCITLWSLTDVCGCVCGFGLMFVCGTSVVQCVPQCDHYRWCLYGRVCAFGLMFVCGTSVEWCASVLVITGAHRIRFVRLCVWLWDADVSGWNEKQQGVILERREIMYKTIQVLSRALLLLCVVTDLWIPVKTVPLKSGVLGWCVHDLHLEYALLAVLHMCVCVCVCVCVCWMQAAYLVDNWQSSKVGYIMWLFSLPPSPSLGDQSYSSTMRGVESNSYTLGGGGGVITIIWLPDQSIDHWNCEILLVKKSWSNMC